MTGALSIKKWRYALREDSRAGVCVEVISRPDVGQYAGFVAQLARETFAIPEDLGVFDVLHADVARAHDLVHGTGCGGLAEELGERVRPRSSDSLSA
jgi:hypothetical protein